MHHVCPIAERSESDDVRDQIRGIPRYTSVTVPTHIKRDIMKQYSLELRQEYVPEGI